MLPFIWNKKKKKKSLLQFDLDVTEPVYLFFKICIGNFLKISFQYKNKIIQNYKN